VLLTELAQQVLSPEQLIIEDPACHSQKIGHQRIANTIPHADAFLSANDDAVRPQNTQLLRHHGLLEGERLLQFLHTPVTPDENLENPDANRVGECLEERRFEGLQISRGACRRLGAGHVNIIYSNIEI
jgi:hypothetical protein